MRERERERERRDVHIGVWLCNLSERDHLNTGVDGRIILKRILKKWYVGGMDWIDLDHYKDRWRTLVNAVMNIRVPYNAGTLLST